MFTRNLWTLQLSIPCFFFPFHLFFLLGYLVSFFFFHFFAVLSSFLPFLSFLLLPAHSFFLLFPAAPWFFFLFLQLFLPKLFLFWMFFSIILPGSSVSFRHPSFERWAVAPTIRSKHTDYLCLIQNYFLALAMALCKKFFKMRAATFNSNFQLIQRVLHIQVLLIRLATNLIFLGEILKLLSLAVNFHDIIIK